MMEKVNKDSGEQPIQKGPRLSRSEMPSPTIEELSAPKMIVSFTKDCDSVFQLIEQGASDCVMLSSWRVPRIMQSSGL